MIVCFYIFLSHIFTTNNPFINLNIFLNKNYFQASYNVSFWDNFCGLHLLPANDARFTELPEDLTGVFLALRGLGTSVNTLVFINKN